jgi:phosphonatase-like hydrolase
MAISLVVFDMAGTTVEDNDNVAEVLQQSMAAFGYDVTIDEINVVMGYPKPVAIRELLQQYAGEAIAADENYVNEIHSRFADEMVRYYQQDEHIREKTGATEVFRKLRAQGIKVALDTGFSRNIANTIFDRLGWEKGEHFDYSITSDEVANGRPYPDMIFKAMELANVASAQEIAKVGDTLSDLQEGNAAGCRYVIGITTGSYSHQELEQEKHTHLAGSLQEVADILMNAQLATAE